MVKTPDAPRVDLKVSPQDTTWDALLQTCREADRSKVFDGLWLFDHLAPVASGSPRPLDEASTCLEGWSTLAAIAQATSHIRVGLLVTAVPYRPARVLAKIVSTVDHISGGRVELGLGAGNTADEATMFGIPFGSVRERLDALEQACIELRLLLDGDSQESLGLTLQPLPVQRHVPIIVGGKGERRTLPIVARYADGWNYSRGTPEEFAAKRAVIVERCDEVGRTIDEIACSVQVRVDHRDPRPGAELAHAYVAAGADQIVLYTQADPDAVAVLGEVAAELRA